MSTKTEDTHPRSSHGNVIPITLLPPEPGLSGSKTSGALDGDSGVAGRSLVGETIISCPFLNPTSPQLPTLSQLIHIRVICSSVLGFLPKWHSEGVET